MIATVNLAEALSTLAARGKDPAAVVTDLTDLGLLDGALVVEPFAPVTRSKPRACVRSPAAPSSHSLIAHASLSHVSFSTTALTADRAWNGLSLGVDCT